MVVLHGCVIRGGGSMQQGGSACEVVNVSAGSRPEQIQGVLVWQRRWGRIGNKAHCWELELG